MEIVKKNIISIISGVIAVIALGALFWPVEGMYGDTQLKLTERQKVAGDLGQMAKAPRLWPVMDVKTGTPVKLQHFPNDLTIEKGGEVRKAVHDQAVDMSKETSRINVHEQLVPGVLPAPGEGRFNFQQQYIKLVLGVAPVAGGVMPLPSASTPVVLSTMQKDLSGTSPATDEEIKAAGQKLWFQTFKPKIITVAGKAVNREQVEADWLAACAKLPAKIQNEHAENAKVYLDPGAIAYSKAIANAPGGPQEKDIWFAQNMIWIQQDLIDAINRVNHDSNRVADSPIKEILHIDVPEDFSQYVLPGGGPALAGGAYSTAPEAIGKAYLRTPTGRVSNSMYDVLQFTMVINVDSRKVPAILAELEKGKLITVTQFDLASVDAATAMELGYIFGDMPVVQLSIHGEEVFLREWTTKLMPEGVRQTLQVAPTVAAK